MTSSVDNGPFTFSNHPAMAQEPTAEAPARPKANPQWMKLNRPTLQLPEPDQAPPPRHFHEEPRADSAPPALNNVDLIDHAFSTPTSATPLASGYHSSGTETPLLGLAGFGFVSEKERDEQFADLNRIFDKISLHNEKQEQERLSQTPDGTAKRRLDKKVSFDVQAPPSPLSAKTHDVLRGARAKPRERPSIWESSVDNEEEILQNMRIQHDAGAAGDTEASPVRHSPLEARDVHSATIPSLTSTFAGEAPRPRSPNTATLPYFTTAYPLSSRAQPAEAPMAAMQHMLGLSPQPKYGHMGHQLHSYPPMHDQARKQMLYHQQPMPMAGMQQAGGMPLPQYMPADGHMQQGYAMHQDYRAAKLQAQAKPMMPLTCFACRGVGHKATQCPTHPRPVVATSSTDVIVTCALHGKPRTSKNMFFNNKLGVWQCFAETECKSMLN